MALKIPPKAKEYYDNQIQVIVKSVVKRPRKKEKPQQLQGSLALKEPLVVDNIVGSMTVGDYAGYYAVHEKGFEIGIFEEAHRKLQIKLVGEIASQNDISKLVRRDYVDSLVFNWLVSRFKGENSEGFSTYLENEINATLKTVLIVFPLKYLEIESAFHVGKVEFNMFTEKSIKELEREGAISSEQVEYYLKRLKGTVYCTATVSGAHPDRAVDYAMSICSHAINSLKLFSETVEYPTIHCNFDLEPLLTFHPSSTLFTIESENGKLTNFFETLHSKAIPSVISVVNYNKKLNSGLRDVCSFIDSIQSSELAYLINLSIDYFGKAISNRDLHRRIVDLFTVVEMFTSKSGDAKILDSIKKYFPKIVTKNVEERKAIAKMVDNTYSIRSSLIHHGKRKSIDLKDLTLLQKSVQLLVLKMIGNIKSFKDKDSILKDWDKKMEAV